MKAICIEVTKVIVLTVEAESYDEAIKVVEQIEADGEYGASWNDAEPQYKLLDEAEVEG